MNETDFSYELDRRANICPVYWYLLLNNLFHVSFIDYPRMAGIEPPFTPFRDAGFCINTFPLTVLDCVRAIYRAKSQHHFNYKTFSLATFQNLAKIQNGDVSWIVPAKFIAFSGPVSK